MTKVFSRSGRTLMLLAGLGVLLPLASSACARVSQEQLDERLDGLRSELEEADRANASRIEEASRRVETVESRLDALEGDLASLDDEFDMTVERLETALRFSTPIHFAYDSAELPNEAPTFLDRFASVVGSYYPDATVTVEGFTDPAGTEEYNLQLGQRRADAVRNYLTEGARLDSERVRAVSYGEDTRRLVLPERRGPGDSGAENRRVALVVDFVPGSEGDAAGS